MGKLETLAETTEDKAKLAELAEHQMVTVRYAVLNNRNVTYDILVTLSNDGNRDIAETAKRLLGGFSESNSSKSDAKVEVQDQTYVARISQSFDEAVINLEKLQSRANSFMGFTLFTLIAGILIVFISLGIGLSSYEGLFGSAAAGFFFFGIVLLQLAFVFAVGYIFTSTMAQHAAVNYHLANRSES